jgi:hypothetical protein
VLTYMQRDGVEEEAFSRHRIEKGVNGVNGRVLKAFN